MQNHMKLYVELKSYLETYTSGLRVKIESEGAAILKEYVPHLTCTVCSCRASTPTCTHLFALGDKLVRMCLAALMCLM